LEEYPELWEEETTSGRIYHFQQPLRLLGADLDIYDISVQIDGKNIHTLPIRKYRLTSFSAFSLEFYKIYADRFLTFLPYYEMHIPVQKGKNTLKITYKNRYELHQQLCNNEHCSPDEIHTFDLMDTTEK